MTYKTILLHINDERRAAQLIDAAVYLADAQEAHLVGLFVVPSGLYGTTVPYGEKVIESGRQAWREEARRIAAMFSLATEGRTLVAEWRQVEPARGHPGPAEAVIEQARTADLVIAGQRDESWDMNLLLDFPDRLALESGRPTLLVPTAGRFAKLGSRVIVAWNGSRESTRAAFDALPLLKRAQAVRILSIEPGRSRGPGTGSAATELAAALARHGVKCDTSRSVNPDVNVGDDLLNRVSDFGADLLVMGCYGHSRFRELVLGGASRAIFQCMTVPVLMSH